MAYKASKIAIKLSKEKSEEWLYNRINSPDAYERVYPEDAEKYDYFDVLDAYHLKKYGVHCWTNDPSKLKKFFSNIKKKFKIIDTNIEDI